MRRRGSANKRDASLEAPGQASRARTVSGKQDLSARAKKKKKKICDTTVYSRRRSYAVMRETAGASASPKT